LVQSALDPTTGSYTYTPLGGSYSTVSLAPGQFTNVVFAVNRAALAGGAGAVSQSLLQISDSLGYTSTNLGVSAVASSFNGVWEGAATVANVDEVLSAQQVNNGVPQTDASGNPIVAITTNSITGVTSSFALRLVLHSGSVAGGAAYLAGANGSSSQLLQQVFIANDANNVQYAGATEAGLNNDGIDAIAAAANTTAGRLSSAFFPPGPNGEPGVYAGAGGGFGTSGSITYTVPLLAAASTNPFLHVYHPDHGPANSNPITRVITLTFQPTLAGVSDIDPGWGSTTLGGTYQETVTGLRAAANSGGVNVAGTFVIHRVNTASTLQP
jgi:hypothetical protein